MGEAAGKKTAFVPTFSSEQVEFLKSKTNAKDSKGGSIDLVIRQLQSIQNSEKKLSHHLTIEVMHYAIKYGSDAQRAALFDIFEKNHNYLLSSKQAHMLLKALFYYGNAKRRKSMINLLSSQLVRLCCLKKTGPVLDLIFVKHLDHSLRYLFISVFFGNNFAIYLNNDVRRTKEVFKELKSGDPEDLKIEKMLRSCAEDVKNTVGMFMEKERLDSPIFHFFLSQLVSSRVFVVEHEIHKILFKEQTILLFLGTHHGCSYVCGLVLALLVEQTNENNFLDELVDGLVSDPACMDKMLQTSSGTRLLYLLCHLETATDKIIKNLLTDFVGSISASITKENCLWLKLIEILPINFFKKKRYSNLQPKKNREVFVEPLRRYLHHFGYEGVSISSGRPLKRICNFLLNSLTNHFLKNSKLLLSEFNYSMAFIAWAPKIIKKNKEVFNEILSSVKTEIVNTEKINNNVFKERSASMFLFNLLTLEKASKKKFCFLNTLEKNSIDFLKQGHVKLAYLLTSLLTSSSDN